MGNPVVDAFRLDLPCEVGDAERLADVARTRLRTGDAAGEDSDEDLVLRLRDPRVFGAFAEIALHDRRLAPATRRAVLEHAFDLLPLPRTEGEVILVESRGPPRLLALAAHLAADHSLTVLHVMHLVYAIFLDRSLVSNVPRRARARLLREVVRLSDSAEGLRLLYTTLHLSTVPASEAYGDMVRILRDRSLQETLRRALATMAAAGDGGRAELVRLARREGLLPNDAADDDSPGILANVPRLPERLAAPARRYLARTRSG